MAIKIVHCDGKSKVLAVAYYCHYFLEKVRKQRKPNYMCD